jgi:hypothetical protein
MIQQETVTVRQEHLCRLADFCQNLETALRAAGSTPEQCLEVFRTAVFAECVGCGIQVSGEELYALSQPPSAELASAKTGRLRLGDCARNGCEAWYYRVSIAPYQQVDWPKLLAEVDAPENQGRTGGSTARWWGLLWERLVRWRMLPRIGVAFAAIVLLLLVRHWHQGGRIPLLREPEAFQVDTAPEEGKSRSGAQPQAGL